jgi:hypothetical protein
MAGRIFPLASFRNKSAEIKMKCRKKPIVVDVVQWQGNNEREVFDFLTGTRSQPIILEGDTFRVDLCNGGCQPGNLIIKTLEGDHLAHIGDYILKSVKGEFYPCKKEIFEETYEVMDASPYETSSEIIPTEEALKLMRQGETLYVNEEHDAIRWNAEKQIFQMKFCDGNENWYNTDISEAEDYSTYHRI